jgi:hypothetical protein
VKILDLLKGGIFLAEVVWYSGKMNQAAAVFGINNSEVRSSFW